MFRKVVQGFTNAATKPGCLGPFQRSLPQQESALPNAYESNDRNVTGLSYKKNTTKVQQPETFSTQHIGVSEFLLGKIPVGGSSGIAKPSLGGDVQFKKLGDTARLNPALCNSESQPVGFGANQQAVKNILAKGEKSDILSGTWGLMQNPINHSFGEDEMTKKNEQGASKDQRLGTPKSENKELKDENQQLEELKNENEELKTKLQESENKNKELKEELDKRISEVNTLTEGKEQLEKNLNGVNQALNEKNEELKSKDEELKNETQQLETLKGENEKLKDENQQLAALKSANEELKTKLQESENKNRELENKIQELEAFKSESEKLKGQNQQLEELKSTNEGKIQQLESRIKELEALKNENEKLKDENKELKTKLQESENRNKELEDNKDSKPPAVNVQGVKSKVNYASASFILSGVCAVGASLATPYLAICAILAVAASVFLALGCHCLYKANTTLSNVEVDQLGNQQLLKIRP